MRSEHRRRHRIGALLLILGALACRVSAEDGAVAPPEINEKFLSPELDVDHWAEIFEGESREIFRNRDEILETVALEPGMRVADIGAGTGLFLAPFARAVGPEGRVFANDISPVFVEHLRERAAKEGLGQVEVVLGGARKTGLAENSVDVVFVCDVYHHFEHPQPMLADLRRALRPGGQLLVIDFERIPGVTGAWIVEHVRAGKEVFRAEIVAAGFVFEAEPKVAGLEENYLLRFRSP